MIPMVNLKQQYAALRDEIIQGLQEALEQCCFILGPNEQAFEKEVAHYLGVKHAIGVASGTDALHLALVAESIGPEDEVITTPYTFIATAEAIRYVGATPVFVDIDPETFNISPEAIEQAVTPKTAAVVPVHLFGQPADLARIQTICDRHQIKLIEDCAQSFGASINGKQTGSYGSGAGFSFFPSKNLGGFGDGGLVTTSSDAIAEKLRMLRNHGSNARYHHDAVGYNSRLDEIQAVILRVKLKYIDEYNRNRRRVAHLYSELMADLPVTTPVEDGIGVHVYHQYTLLSERRDEIMRALHNADIACAIYYPIPLHRQKVFAAECGGLSLPVTDRVAERCLSLPIYPELEETDIHKIVAVVESVFR